MDANDNNGFLTLLAKTIGAGEPTIRLLLSVFGGIKYNFLCFTEDIVKS